MAPRAARWVAANVCGLRTAIVVGVADPQLQALIVRAQQWRNETLVYLRSQHWVDGIAWMLAKGVPFPSLPASWAALDRQEQARRLARAEVARLERARTFAFPADLVERLRLLALEDDLTILLVEGTLPKGPGFAVFAEPIGPDLDGMPVAALSWGPVHPDMSAGLIATWWAQAPPEFPAPLMFADDLHLTFHPYLDRRLLAPDQWPESARTTAPTMRATVAALRLIAQSDNTPAPSAVGKRREARPKPVVLGQAPQAFAALRAALHAESKTRLEGALYFGALSPTRSRVPDLSDPLFAQGAEAGLDAGSRHWPAISRDVAAQITQLERRAEQRNPGIFAYLEEIRARRWGNWPRWCWMPVIDIGKELIALQPSRDKRELLFEAHTLAALGALRAGGRAAVIRQPYEPERESQRALESPVPDPDQAQVPGLAVVDVYRAHEADSPAAHAAVFAYLDVDPDRRPQLYLLPYAWSSAVLNGARVFQLLLGEQSVEAAGRATAEISLRPVREDGSRYTTAEVATEIAATAATYLPELNAAFSRSAGSELVELAFALGLRPHPPAWPHPDGTQAPLTLWLPRGHSRA